MEMRRYLLMRKTKSVMDIALDNAGYIRLNRNPVDLTSPATAVGYFYAVVDCRAGDILTISGTTGNALAALLYAVLDKDNMILLTVPYGFVADNHTVTIPDSGAKIVINQRDSVGRVTATLTTWR